MTVAAPDNSRPVKPQIDSLLFPLSTTITSLSLTSCSLKIVPEVLFKMENLVDLDLSNNKLTRIPLESLPSLERLNLRKNFLSHFTHKISRVLTELYLNENKLTCFSIRNFRKLQILDLENNQLPHFVACVKLKHLVCLKLIGNPLTEFTVNNNLPQLQYLSLPKAIYQTSAEQMHTLKKVRAITVDI